MDPMVVGETGSPPARPEAIRPHRALAIVKEASGDTDMDAGIVTDIGGGRCIADGNGDIHKNNHGDRLIACTGIMLAFRWYITHSEPVSAITTMMTVKISAIRVQPFSAWEVMCRKKTM